MRGKPEGKVHLGRGFAAGRGGLRGGAAGRLQGGGGGGNERGAVPGAGGGAPALRARAARSEGCVRGCDDVRGRGGGGGRGAAAQRLPVLPDAGAVARHLGLPPQQGAPPLKGARHLRRVLLALLKRSGSLLACSRSALAASPRGRRHAH